MTEEVKKQRAGFLDSIETARSCERYGEGWPDWVESDLDALIAAVEREALERAETKCNGIAKGWFEARDPDDFTRGCAGGAIACREAVRALIESKEG